MLKPNELLEKYQKNKNLTFLPIPENLLDCDFHANIDGRSLVSAIKDFEKHRARKFDLYPHFLTDTFVEMCSAVLNRTWYREKLILQSIDPNSSFLTFGSCFAAEIHRYLMGYGIQSYTLTLADHVNSPRMSRDGLSLNYKPRDSYHWDLSNPSDHATISIYQDEVTSDQYLQSINLEEELQILKREHVYRSERFIDQYGYLRSKIAQTDIIIFTIGTAIKKDRGKLNFENVADTVAFLDEIRRIIYNINEDATVFFSLSPVPLQGFSGINKSCLSAVEADSISKSISRVAIHQYFDLIDRCFEFNTFYFPSYEIVRWIAPYYLDSVWSDPHHIERRLAKLICKLFISTFLQK